MPKAIIQTAIFAAIFLSSAAFASNCDNELMAVQSRLQENAAKLKQLYSYIEYDEKTAAEYESSIARLLEYKRLVWVDAIEAATAADVIQLLIERKASGTTQRGYAYSVKNKTLSLTKGAQKFSVVLDTDFGAGFSVRNENTRNTLQYTRR